MGQPSSQKPELRVRRENHFVTESNRIDLDQIYLHYNQTKTLLIPAVADLTFHKLPIVTSTFDFFNLSSFVRDSQISHGQKEEMKLTDSPPLSVIIFPFSQMSS